VVLAHQQYYSISAQMIPRTAIFLSLDAINHLNLPHLDAFAGSEVLSSLANHKSTRLFSPSLAPGSMHTALNVWWHLELGRESYSLALQWEQYLKYYSQL